MNYLAVDIGSTFNQNGFLSKTTDVGQLVSLIVSNGIVIAGVILMFLLVAGGIGMIAGAGSNNPEQMASSRKAITAAVIGFVIVFAAYWIVQLIQAITGVKILG